MSMRTEPIIVLFNAKQRVKQTDRCNAINARGGKHESKEQREGDSERKKTWNIPI
jgi:hypothetical protein